MTNTLNIGRFVVAIIALTVTASSFAREEEALIYDPQSGNYTIIYRGTYPPHDMVQAIFVPATKIDPQLESQFSIRPSNVIHYRYRLRNGKQSKQSIDGIRLSVSDAEAESQTIPKNWFGLVVPNDDIGSGTRVSWSYDGKEHLDGIKPGKQSKQFMFDSRDIPGLAFAHLTGARPAQGYEDEGPDHESEVGKQLQVLERNDFVPRLAAVPRIPIPTPFDAVAVLGGIRTHIDQDLLSMQLIDPVFANELNRLFTAAIEAAKHNNDKGVKENLKDIRKALKKAHRDMEDEDGDERKHRHGNKDDSDDWEHTDPKQKPKPVFIDKLAARVLDFDVKYVLGRLDKD